jgi:SPP1 family predicted phage head-tail adaptor
MSTTGQKRTPIRIESAVKVANGQGGFTTSYTLRCEVWAHERALTGGEALQAAKLTAVRASVFEIWFRDDISVKDRIVLGSRVLHIEAYRDPDDTRREIYVFASEVQA